MGQALCTDTDINYNTALSSMANPTEVCSVLAVEQSDLREDREEGRVGCLVLCWDTLRRHLGSEGQG